MLNLDGSSWEIQMNKCKNTSGHFDPGSITITTCIPKIGTFNFSVTIIPQILLT